MSESAPRSGRNDRRRRRVILWTIAAVLVVLLLLMLGFCIRNGDSNNQIGGPTGLPGATSEYPPPDSPLVRPAVDPRSSSASAEPSHPSRGASSSGKHTTVPPPRGGAGTGGGGRAPGGGQLVAVGMLALLGAAGAAVYAARPRRSRP